MNTQSYDCHRKPDGCGDDDLKEIGDFSWRSIDGVVQGMSLCLPNLEGNGVIDWIPVSREGSQFPGQRVWGWDGNLDQPTLQPSLHLLGRWHGYLKAGRLVSC